MPPSRRLAAGSGNTDLGTRILLFISLIALLLPSPIVLHVHLHGDLSRLPEDGTERRSLITAGAESALRSFQSTFVHTQDMSSPGRRTYFQGVSSWNTAIAGPATYIYPRSPEGSHTFICA